MDAPQTGWTAIDEDADPLRALHGAEVGQGVRLSLEVGARDGAGTRAFRAFLDSDELGVTARPVMLGLHHAGAYPASNWLEVTDFADRLPVGGGEAEVPEGIDLRIIHALAELVPPGGHLMMEYDSPHRRSTARSLAQGVPPVATPLGGMMFAVGCGAAFVDCRDPWGESTGPRKLRGYRAADPEHEARRGAEMLRDLERFLATSSELDWDLQLKCRPLAEAAVTVLRSRLGVLAGAFILPDEAAAGEASSE